MNSRYLIHHGVKGMRWGHRKDRIGSNKKKLRSQDDTIGFF